jgi:sugar-specific transcriptional regulator TrmB
MSLYAHLQHFGLSDKEARVYIAALEIGPSPVQVISRKAQVNRATTYVQIASLSGRGLMTSYEQGKKRFFVAESPERLAAIYEDELQHLRDKERVLKEIMPELKRMRPGVEMPTVRLFEGHDGLEVVRAEYLKAEKKHVVGALGDEYYMRAIPPESRARAAERVRQARIEGSVLISVKDVETERKRDDARGSSPLINRRYVAHTAYDIPGEVVVFDKKIVMLSYKGDPLAVVIESAELSVMLRSVLELAFKGAKE